MARAQAGDSNALSQLIAAHLPVVYGRSRSGGRRRPIIDASG